MGAIWVSRIDELMARKTREERREVTVEELADFVGVSRQTVHTWKSIKGVKTVPADSTARLCAFFGCKEWDLWELVHIEEVEPGMITAGHAA